MNDVRTVNIQYLPSPEETDDTKNLKAGKFLWPGFTHNYQVWAKQLSGGKWKYQTGLNLAETPEEKKDEIKEAISDIENYYGEGSLDPFNHDFWKDIRLVINKKNIFLDIANNMEHKLLYYVIKGGGFFEVAPTYDLAVNDSQPKRFFMVEPEELANISAVSDRTINKAIARLEDLDENLTFEDMFIIHKVLVSSDRGTTKETPKSALYKDLSDFIAGKIVKTDKRQTPKQFVETYELLKTDKKKLYIQSYVKEANYFNFLTVTEDNQFQNVETKTKYGASLEKVVAFLSNPKNQSELENIKERVQNKWSK